MKNFRSFVVSVTVCCVFGMGCVAPGSAGGPRAIAVGKSESFRQSASAFEFPPALAEFERAAVNQYDKDGRDVGVGYNHVGYGVALTVYVYPVAQEPPNNELAGHFQVCKGEIVRSHSGTRKLSENTIRVQQGGVERQALWAAFEFEQVFAGKNQMVGSELWLFRSGNWFLKYRATYPAGQKQVAERAVEKFVDQLAWPAESAKTQ